MIDIQFIRENPEVVRQKSAQKTYPVDVDRLLELDGQRRDLQTKLEVLQHERNELSGATQGQRPSDEQIAKGRELKEQISTLEEQLKQIEPEFMALWKSVPNMPFDEVPVGASEDENVVAKTVGEQPAFDFAPKSHAELGTALDIIDKERAAKVAGSRFAYLKGDLVLLQFALMNWVAQTLSDENVLKTIIEQNGLSVSSKPFTTVLPPAMIKTSVFDAMDRLEPRDDRYRVGEPEDDLWLQGSAEHTLGSMYMDEVLEEDQLPIRYLGYSSSFRREAGTYGKDTEGIIRMHQFDKLEIEVFSTAETGLQEHKLMVAIQEFLMQQLGISYRLIQKCTADIGKPNAIGMDIDAWMPGQGKYRETHTADYMTDYQTRRLRTRVKRKSGDMELAHTNDATAFAMGRTLIAIMENYQTAEGHIRVPAVLQSFMGGKTQI